MLFSVEPSPPCKGRAGKPLDVRSHPEAAGRAPLCDSHSSADPQLRQHQARTLLGGIQWVFTFPLGNLRVFKGFCADMTNSLIQTTGVIFGGLGVWLVWFGLVFLHLAHRIHITLAVSVDKVELSTDFSGLQSSLVP